MPAADMPADVRSIYEEARAVASASPRAAAALLRVAIERLINDRDPGDGTLYDKIERLGEQGLDRRVQRMLHTVRIVGNDTLHAAEIDLDEQPEMPTRLMRLVNQIVEQVITRNRELDDLWNSLPEDKVRGFKDRDQKAGTSGKGETEPGPSRG